MKQYYLLDKEGNYWCKDSYWADDNNTPLEFQRGFNKNNRVKNNYVIIQLKRLIMKIMVPDMKTQIVNVKQYDIIEAL